MKARKISALVLSILMLMTICACGKNAEPLWKLYPGERIKTLTVTLPDTIDISVNTSELSVTLYDIGDKELTGKIAEAFLAITADEKTEVSDFKAGYSVDFVWDDEVVSVALSENIAEVAADNGTAYYKTSHAEDFISLLQNAALESEKAAFDNADRVVDEQNVTVDVMRNISVSESGDYMVGINVINNRPQTVGIVLSDIKADKLSAVDSGILYVNGKSEIGFSVPIILPEKGSFNKISFKIEVGIGTEEPFEAFITSSDYVIKAD